MLISFVTRKNGKSIEKPLIQYESEWNGHSDNGLEVEESYPFTATLKLDLSEESIENISINIDDSMYY